MASIDEGIKVVADKMKAIYNNPVTFKSNKEAELYNAYVASLRDQWFDLIPTLGGETEWGAITGDLLDQTDLIEYISTLTPTIEETDPIFSGSDAASITASDIDNWNESFSWGNPTIRIDGGTSTSIYNSLSKIDGGTA